MTARISGSQFTYTFNVRPGQKFIRLNFYPFSYIGFDVSTSLFSVKAGPYTLLSNFSASLIADSLGVRFFAKEFLVNVDDNQALTITFSPSASTSSVNVFAFINGIEIVSMPTGVYYSLKGDLGVPVVGEDYRFYIANRTALEMVYRLNIGGSAVLPVEDLGMFRLWSEDRIFLLESGGVSVHTNTMINYRHIRPYVAPPRIYQTAWSLGGPNLTWKLPLNLGFRYLIRLHFYELESEKAETGKSDFDVFMNDQIAEIDEGVIIRSGQNGIPVYRDYLVTVEGDRMEGKRDLIIALRLMPKHESGTRQNNVLLNGLEIFKLSNPDYNLAGPNPNPVTRSLTSWTSKLRRLVLTFGGGNLIATSATLLFTLVNIIVYQLNHLGTRSGEKNKSTPWEEKLCRSFSLAEMQLATNNFDDELVVGIGGFGKVYKGTIDRGAMTVAIKRLKLESKQGVQEFRMEIETLSTFRHIHLVSLIGYCDEGQEMLLVYEYMCRGTLADCLYKIRNRNGSGSGISPLSWEQRLRICIGAARGLDYLHTGSGRGALHVLIHRDIKSSNILLDENWVAKISDFGLSKMDAINLSHTHISTNIKGTFGYLDPEYIKTRWLTRKSDFYAFGVVLFEVLCGRPAVDISLEEEEQHSLALWVKGCIEEGELNKIVDPNVREQISLRCLNAFAVLANKCLHNSPNKRPTMAEVVTGLESALERQGNAYFDEEEYIDISDDQIIGTPSTSDENTSNVDHSSISYGECSSPEVCAHLPLSEIEEATDNFAYPIGDDTYSKMYRGHTDDMDVTVQLLTSNARYEDFLTEVKLLSQLWHLNVMRLVGYCDERSMMILVYDHVFNGTLYDRLHFTARNNLLSWKHRLRICIDVTRGLNYLHTGTECMIVHGDVNPRSISLDDKWVARILKPGGHSSICMAPLGYCDPEYFSTSTLTEKSDVYSLGIVLFEVLCGRKIIDREPDEGQHHLIFCQGFIEI